MELILTYLSDLCFDLLMITINFTVNVFEFLADHWAVGYVDQYVQIS